MAPISRLCCLTRRRDEQLFLKWATRSEFRGAMMRVFSYHETRERNCRKETEQYLRNFWSRGLRCCFWSYFSLSPA